MAEKSTEYQPTDREEKILEVLLNPENKDKTVTEICGLAGCDRKTYYKAFRKPDFAELYRNLSLDLIKSHVAPIVNTFIKEAMRGSFNHGKVCLEMAEMYTEKQQHELTGDIHVNFNIPRPPKNPPPDEEDDA